MAKSEKYSEWWLLCGTVSLNIDVVFTIGYRCADQKKVGELRGDIGAIR